MASVKLFPTIEMADIRAAIARWIAPAGTTIVPPLRPSPLPRAGVAQTPPSVPGMVRVMIPRVSRQAMGTVFIKQCRDPSMWYTQHVGEFVPVLGHMEGDWKVRDTSGFINVVRYDDAICIKDDK